MKLTESQKQFFYEEGYLRVPGAVSRVMVDAARQAINAEIGKGNTNPFPEINATPVNYGPIQRNTRIFSARIRVGRRQLAAQSDRKYQTQFSAPTRQFSDKYIDGKNWMGYKRRAPGRH